MTTAGWIFMTASLLAVTTLVASCFRKVLSAPAESGDKDAG